MHRNVMSRFRKKNLYSCCLRRKMLQILLLHFHHWKNLLYLFHRKLRHCFPMQKPMYFLRFP